MLTARTEVTDRMLIFGERHPRSILADYEARNNGRRPHRSRQLRPPRPDHPTADLSCQPIKRQPILSGLTNEYEPAAYKPRSSLAAEFWNPTRNHTESDLRCYLSWCTDRGLDPLAARRPHLELYIRWMQEVRRFKPSAVSRRFSITAGFYRTCVIDGVLGHSPAEYVRRPSVPAESPTLGFTYLQFEALLTVARESANRYGFALVAMLGLLGLRIFEATGAVPTAIEAAAKRRGVDGLSYVVGDATGLPPARGAAAALMDASGTSNRTPQIPGQFRRSRSADPRSGA